MDIGTPELLIVVVIVVLLFGVGRLGRLGAEAGEALRAFRQGLKGDDDPISAPPPSAPDTPGASRTGSTQRPGPGQP
ncbi:MAG: twin-arginine translocase TatA/TatE family subunit [Anaerolineales bacterium]|nr:twin-arginine translocase TatA/TatE family subunit [Anaerolineales bacterium]